MVVELLGVDQLQRVVLLPRVFLLVRQWQGEGRARQTNVVRDNTLTLARPEAAGQPPRHAGAQRGSGTRALEADAAPLTGVGFTAPDALPSQVLLDLVQALLFLLLPLTIQLVAPRLQSVDVRRVDVVTPFILWDVPCKVVLPSDSVGVGLVRFCLPLRLRIRVLRLVVLRFRPFLACSLLRQVGAGVVIDIVHHTARLVAVCMVFVVGCGARVLSVTRHVI